MAAKIALLAVVALCATQVVYGARTKNIIDDMINQAAAKANEAVDHMTEVTDAGVKQAVEFVQGAIQTAHDQLNGLKEQVLEAVNKIGPEVAQKVEDVLEKAKENGIDVTDCVSGKAEEGSKVVEDAAAGVAQCLDVAKSVGTTISADVQTLGSELTASVDEVAADLKACLPEQITNHTLQEVQEIATCIAKEIETIQYLEKDISNKLKSAMEKAETSIVAAVKQATACIQSTEAVAVGKERALIKEVESCLSSES